MVSKREDLLIKLFNAREIDVDEVSPLPQLMSKSVLVATERKFCRRGLDFGGRLDWIGIRMLLVLRF